MPMIEVGERRVADRIRYSRLHLLIALLNSRLRWELRSRRPLTVHLEATYSDPT
jgi:hypothetical protein